MSIYQKIPNTLILIIFCAVPNGHTGHVRFITSHRLQDGQGIVVSGGDGYEQFSPGTGSNLSGPTDLFHFMSYCSNLAVII